MDSKLKVSVLLPTYNRSEMLRRAIDSFLNQDYENSELVIFNNGSTDDTKEVIESYLPNPKIKVFWTNNNVLPPNNFNMMVEYLFTDLIVGDIICWLHDDDAMLKNGLSLRVSAFSADPELQVLYAGWVTNGVTFNADPPNKDRIIYEEYINFLTMMFRKDVNMLMDKSLRYYHDWLFKIECFRKYKVGYISEPVIDYTVHAGQASVECRKLGMNGPEEKLMREKLEAVKAGEL
jgi:glycosyltransferase involved in cell wall biosynthesis